VESISMHILKVFKILKQIDFIMKVIIIMFYAY